MPLRARPRYSPNRNQWTIYYQGKDRYLCAGAANEALAWTKAEQLRGLPPGVEHAPTTVTAAVVTWLDQRGHAWHKWILEPFAAFGAGTLLTQVHEEYLDDYLAHLVRKGFTRKVSKRRSVKREYSASTLRRHISLANRVLQWSHVRGHLPQRPPRMPRLPQEQEVDRSLTAEQVRAIFAELPARAAEVLRFIALTGCRPAEACALQVAEVRGAVCELRRGKTFARTGKPRILYLSDGAQQIVARQGRESGYVFLNRGGEPYKPSGLRSIIRRAAEYAGLKVSGAYVLRHSFAQLALDDVDLGELAELLGHVAGSRVTRRYARIRGERALNAAMRAKPLVPADPPRAPEPATEGVTRRTRKTDRPNQKKTAKGRSRRRVG